MNIHILFQLRFGIKDGTLTFISQQGGFRKISKAKLKNKYKVNTKNCKYKKILKFTKKKQSNKQIKKQNKSLSLRRNKSTKRIKRKD